VGSPSLARAAPLVLFVERFFLSAFLLYLAWGEAVELRRLQAAFAAPVVPDWLLGELTKHALLFLLDLLVGALLLLSRRSVVPPQAWRDVLVPLAANFFYLAYNLAGWAPAPLQANLWQEAWRGTLARLALVVALVGFLLALWAAAHLGRSFAVLVTLKGVVAHGPYRYVRHPLYLSYLFQAVGLVCAYGSLAFLALAAAHVGLLVHRARLEEALLLASSAEYRLYRERTPFLLPRLRRRGEE
jgi:protein-S-isoprenylcysteine O-methyltransferase Ste14